VRRTLATARTLAAAALLAAVLALGLPARAATVSVSVTPGTLTASLRSTLPTTLSWTVKVTNFVTAAPVGLTFTSTQGSIITPNGQVLQIDPRPLTVRLSAGGQGSVTETFTLSPATVAEALRLGAETLLLQRTFGVPPFAGIATASIAISGNAGGPIAISRVELHFEDRQLRRVIESGESAVAIAEVNFSGSGVLNAEWEVASPPSTLGQAVFVPLAAAVVNVTGGGLTEITSPPLPARIAGAYYVRFRVRSPAVPFEGLVLQYAVAGDDEGITPIAIVSPSQHATLREGTRFEWQPAPGAAAYRLEIYDSGATAADQTMISGQWVTGGERDAALSRLAQTHLGAGRSYRWRIVAVDEGAQVVGRSSLYEIRTP
jgi:hypothetical protein